MFKLLLIALFIPSTKAISHSSNGVKHKLTMTSTSNDVMASNNDVLMTQILNALYKAISYVERHYRELNVDGLAGIYIANGELKRTVRFKPIPTSATSGLPSTTGLPLLRKKISHISNRLEKTIRKIDSKFKKNNDPYWREMTNVMRLIAEYRSTPKKFAEGLVWKTRNMLEFTRRRELVNDRCLSEITGTTRHVRKCHVTHKCWNMMTMKNTWKYFLTHQALDLLAADASGCRYAIDARMRPFTFDNILSLYGSNIVAEMKAVRNDQGPGFNADLFLEQTSVCCMLGMDSCLRLNWLKMILKWQTKDGCIGEDEVKNEDSDSLDDVGRDVERDDVVMSGGCSSHTTGLFLANLASYVNALYTKRGMGA